MRINKKYLAISFFVVFLIFIGIAVLCGPNFIAGDLNRKTYNRAVIQSVSISLNGFHKTNGFYPKNKDGLNALLCNRVNNKSYCLPSIPIDDAGNKINYKNPGFHNANGFDIWIDSDHYGIIGNW